MFICPKCRGKLNILQSGSAACESGHSFDRSREGYYNLLLGVGGGVHGDNAEMIAARRDFLSRGFYQPLADKIAELAVEICPSPRVFLDAGCGEGYYTDRLIRAYGNVGIHPQIHAFDISKAAVKRAAKLCRVGLFAVASSYSMPLEDSSVDILLNTFSPLALDESLRVLKHGGVFIMAIPAEEHLFALKEKIYDTPYKNQIDDTNLTGFSLLREERLSFNMSMKDKASIASLFMMTPYAYRTGAEGRARVQALESLECGADFMILAYRKD